MKDIYHIKKTDFCVFIDNLKKDWKVFSPVTRDSRFQEEDYCYQAIKSAEGFTFNPYRAVEPLKLFFTHHLEKVGEYFNGDKNVIDLGKTVVLGVKSCDITAHKIQDFVFLEGVEVDSLYRLRRENTVFISSDCTDFKKVCFCLALDILPYPTEGFDLNLSPLNDGYLVEVGSKKGDEFIKKYQDFFAVAKETQILGRKNKRDNLIDRLRRHILAQNIPSPDKLQGLVKKGYASDTWQKFMLPCVECGGCNLICDTCHCFLLSDEKRSNGKNLRLRQWDSCQYANFSRVAGGANPLKTRAQRLRNRFMKKFDFFIDNLGRPGCCGCGRCIEVCPGKIDIREVLKDLAKKIA